MHSPFLKAAELIGLHKCCTTPPPKPEDPTTTTTDKPPSKIRNTSAICRHGFTNVTTTSLFPNTYFTNPESIPSFQESFIQFIRTYPNYSNTKKADLIRAQEYYHLSISKNICLDYIGIGLFSYWQIQSHHNFTHPIASSSSSSTSCESSPCFFTTSFKSVNLKQELLDSSKDSIFESNMKKRIMGFLKMSSNDYSMVFTANKSSAFKLLAESYPFQSSQKLLTVYDYESEALETMVNSSEKKGAQIISAEFKWPRLRVDSEKLRKMILCNKKKKKKIKNRGLFIFPLQSRMSGASYSYQWMSLAQENGWHVLLDGCALGPKDMGSFGLSLISPDFLICSFYKVFGDNPTGYGCLFVKKSTLPILDDCFGIPSIGIVSLSPTITLSIQDSYGPVMDTEHDTTSTPELQHSFQEKTTNDGKDMECVMDTVHDTTDEVKDMECKCLDQIDSLGLMLISSRGRFLINWLVNALMKLQHPNRLDVFPLVQIYGPKVKFDRGPALAFNIYDWKGEKVEASLVQKIADRNNITLSIGFLQNICFAGKYEKEKGKEIEEMKKGDENNGRRRTNYGINVVSIALNFLVNFEDIYRLWAFIAQFLDADFVEKERWRYTALNQKISEVLLD